MNSAKPSIRREAALWSGLLLIAAFGLGAQILRAAFDTDLPVPAPTSAAFSGQWRPSLGVPQAATKSDEGIDPRRVADALVRAIIEIESGGDPSQVGAAGERGLMQIKRATWRETTALLYGAPIPFSRAFEPELNVQVGRAYLGTLQGFLLANRSRWRSDERTLLLCAYNAGPSALARAGFDPAALGASVRSYAERGAALHELFLEADAEEVRQRLLAALGQPAIDSAPRLR